MKLRPVSALLLLGLVLAGCHKVPLEPDTGRIDFGVAHWFANEQVAYVFFSLSERQARLIDPVWQLSWTGTNAAGGVTVHPYTAIDFSQGVYEHSATACGPDRICASYSFPSDGPLTQASLRFLYDKNSPLALELPLSISNHAAGLGADSQSALVYGVFDEANQHVQIRVHNNFGTPEDSQIAAFGMRRRFRITHAALQDVDQATLEQAKDTSGTPLLFPAPFCDPESTGGDGDQIISDGEGWLAESFDKADSAGGVCFTSQLLDKHGAPLPSGKLAGYGRRNPEIRDAPSLTLTTPLKETVQLPLAVEICPDDPAAGAMVDPAFLKYQEYILGFGDRPADICFHIGDETGFATDFATLAAKRLASAKASATDDRDFMFIVLLHEAFSSEFRAVQSAIAESLYALADDEAKKVSPRLVGALVYAGSTLYQPTALQKRYVLWCPQDLADEVLQGSSPLANQNCTTSKASSLDLQVINFVAPLGPFPSLSHYQQYVSDFGDTGLAHSPKLRFLSVPAGVSTVTEQEDTVTYFDNERYVIGPGEAARICRDRADLDLASFRIRPTAQDAGIPGLKIDEINKLWLSDDAAGEYKLGIAWEYPFWGGVSYTGALSGKVMSIVPFQKSFKSYETLGDPKWSTTSWDFGRYVQHCYRYCDHPFFDAAGTYQAQTGWRSYDGLTCPVSTYPKWPGGAPP